MLNLFLTALPLLGNYLFSQKNKKQSQQTIQTNQKRYEQKLSQLDSLFNRNYYSNILDRSDVRGLLGNLREQMSETTRNLKNKATITGATPETVVTVQKSQNQAYGNAVSQIASQAATWKENTLQNYLSARSALEDFYRPLKSDYMNNILGKTFPSFNPLQICSTQIHNFKIMDTIFTTENSQPTKTLADYINEGKSFLEAYQAQSPKRLARGKAYEQVEMLKELLNLLHQPDNTEVQQVTDVLIPKTYPEKEKRFLNYLSWLTFISDRNKPKHPCPPLSEKILLQAFRMGRNEFERKHHIFNLLVSIGYPLQQAGLLAKYLDNNIH